MVIFAITFRRNENMKNCDKRKIFKEKNFKSIKRKFELCGNLSKNASWGGGT